MNCLYTTEEMRKNIQIGEIYQMLVSPDFCEAKAQAAIHQVAQMIAARLQSRDPITQSEGYRLLTACPFAEDEVHKILCENR